MGAEGQMLLWFLFSQIWGLLMSWSEVTLLSGTYFWSVHSRKKIISDVMECFSSKFVTAMKTFSDNRYNGPKLLLISLTPFITSTWAFYHLAKKNFCFVEKLVPPKVKKWLCLGITKMREDTKKKKSFAFLTRVWLWSIPPPTTGGRMEPAAAVTEHQHRQRKRIFFLTCAVFSVGGCFG